MNAAAVQATVQAAARDAVASVTKIIKEADSQQLKIAIGSASAAVVVAVALYRRASKPPPPPPPPPPRRLELTQLHSFDVPKELTIPHYFDLDAAEVRALAVLRRSDTCAAAEMSQKHSTAFTALSSRSSSSVLSKSIERYPRSPNLRLVKSPPGKPRVPGT